VKSSAQPRFSNLSAHPALFIQFALSIQSVQSAFIRQKPNNQKSRYETSNR
jgi:hypothetical protein